MAPILKGEDWFREPGFPFQISRHIVAEAYPNHKHEFFEFFFMVKGGLTHHVGNTQQEISRGDLVLLNPSRSHAFELIQDKPAEKIECIFMPSFLEVDHVFLKKQKKFTELVFMEPFYNAGCMIIPLSGRTELKVRALLEELLEEYANRPAGYGLAIRTKLTDLLITIARSFIRPHNTDTDSVSVPPADSLIDTLAIIEERFREPLTLDEIAAEAGFGKEYFCRVFHNITGTTFTRYVNGLRIAYAREQLLKRNDKIIAIALDAGFNDLSYFNRTFKAICGMTPSAWRANTPSIQS